MSEDYVFEKYYREIRAKDGAIERIETSVPAHFNFAYDVVDWFAERTPDKPALLHKSINGALTEFTFGDMKRLSDEAAIALSEVGVCRGDAVMLLLKRRYEFWIAMLALHKLGAIAVPTSHMVSAEDIARRAEKAHTKAILCVNSEHICEKVETAVRGTCVIPIAVGERYGEFRFWDDLMSGAKRSGKIWERVETDVSDPMLYYFTSGTNGEPKAVIHDWSYPVAHIYTAKHWHGIKDGDLHLTVADSGWAKTAWGKLYGQWFLGARILVYDYDRFYAGEFLSLLTELKVNTFCAPPTIYKYLVMEDLLQYDWSALRCAATAGEPMPTAVAKSFAEATGVTVRDGFGQTETALQICTPVGSNPVPGSIGKASPLYRIEIADEQGNFLPDGEEGELVIVPQGSERPIGIFCGYLGEEERYREVWRGGAYHTGDRAKRDADGNFYFFGRNDDVIKSSGYRIGPSEVENLLMQHEAVKFCAVTGYPSKTRGTVVKASIVLKDGFAGDQRLTTELQDYVKKNGAVYKYPRMIVYVDDLPRSSSGKINRAAIRRADEEKLRQSDNRT
ncbi:MAG: AMP-binding protein [Lachnospiraceae bacterium]|nr:AMP-binding protein [Lachnospiraceae bacterium]